MAADIKMFGGGCFPWPWYDFYDIYGFPPLQATSSSLQRSRAGRRTTGSWYLYAHSTETPQLMVSGVSEANALTGDGEIDTGFGDHLYGTFAVLFMELPDTNPEMLCVNYCTGVYGIELRLCADGKIKMYYGGSLLGTSAASVGDGKWHIIEYKQDQPSGGAYELRIDNSTEFSGTTSMTTNAISRVYLGKRLNRATESYSVLFDDMVWCHDDYVTYGAVVGCSQVGEGYYSSGVPRYFEYEPIYDPDNAPYVPFSYWWEGTWGGLPLPGINPYVYPGSRFPDVLEEFYSDTGFGELGGVWLTRERKFIPSASGIVLSTDDYRSLKSLKIGEDREPIYAIRTSYLCKRSLAANSFKLFLRSNGSNYENTVAVSLNESLRYTYSQLWQQDPGRSVDWTAVTSSLLEMGVHCIDGTVSANYHLRFFEGLGCESGSPCAPGAMLVDCGIHILSAYAPRDPWTTWNLGG